MLLIANMVVNVPAACEIRAQSPEGLTLGDPPGQNTGLLHRVGEGEAQAVTECIDRFGGLVWSLARKLIGNASEAEDAVQEVFIELWKKASRYDPSVASETTFVAMIARRRLIDRWRQKGRRVNGDAVDVSDTQISAAEDGYGQLELAEEAARVKEAMRQLRPQQQKVLSLAVCEGWSHQLIADSLSLPLGTVKTHVRRGLMRVRELLEVNSTAEGKEARP